MRRVHMLSVAIGVTAMTAGGSLHGQAVSSAVRAERGDLQGLVARGIERSETFRELATRLDQSDVVVYVQFGRCDAGAAACLVLASQGAGPRRLLIKLDRSARSPDDLIALLGHELQHANEVASAPEVTDAASFRKLFEREGWKGSAGFETEHARNITRKVAAELNGRASRLH